MPHGNSHLQREKCRAKKSHSHILMQFKHPSKSKKKKKREENYSKTNLSIVRLCLMELI